MHDKIGMYFTGVLYNSKSQTGGIKRFVELAEYICKNNADSVLFSRDNEETIYSRGINSFVKLTSNKQGKSLLPPEARILLANKNVIKYIRHEQFDNVIVFDVPMAIGLMLFGVKNVVLMIRKDMIGYEKVSNKNKWKWLKIFYQYICESICLYRSRLVICQCIYDKEVLKYRHPFLKNRIENKTMVQINNVNPSWVRENSTIKEIDAVDSKEDCFRVCFIGGFDNPRKGQDIFLKAAIELLNRQHDIQFILIGGGNRLEEYKRNYRHPNISFMGRMDNPISLLRRCDLLVVPSYADSCPNTVMEGLYNGVPVIGSKAGGIPEILVNPDSLFDLDYKKLAEKILKLVNSPELLQALKLQQSTRKRELSFNWSERICNIIADSF